MSFYFVSFGKKLHNKNMINACVLDDRKSDADLLVGHLSRFEKQEKIDIKTTVYMDPLLFLSSKEDFDILFFDVEMPALNGIQVAEKLRETDKDTALIFVTNMAQYAIDGYRVDALDYVLKPVSYEDFVLKMKKAIRHIEKNLSAAIIVKTTENEQHKLETKDISYVEVMSHYLSFHMKSGRVYEVRGTLKSIEETLRNHHFSKCGKSYIVNLNQISSVTTKTVQIGKDKIAISRSFKDSFLKDFYKTIGNI